MSGRGSRIRISLRARAAQEIAILQTTYDFMTILRPLSSFLKRYWKRFSVLVLFYFILVCFFYLLCLQLGQMDFFQSLLSKMGFSLGGRALSFTLC